jgi:hypothetical protein
VENALIGKIEEKLRQGEAKYSTSDQSIEQLHADLTTLPVIIKLGIPSGHGHGGNLSRSVQVFENHV